MEDCLNCHRNVKLPLWVASFPREEPQSEIALPLDSFSVIKINSLLFLTSWSRIFCYFGVKVKSRDSVGVLDSMNCALCFSGFGLNVAQAREAPTLQLRMTLNS